MKMYASCWFIFAWKSLNVWKRASDSSPELSKKLKFCQTEKWRTKKKSVPWNYVRAVYICWWTFLTRKFISILAYEIGKRCGGRRCDEQCGGDKLITLCYFIFSAWQTPEKCFHSKWIQFRARNRLRKWCWCSLDWIAEMCWAVRFVLIGFRLAKSDAIYW